MPASRTVTPKSQTVNSSASTTPATNSDHSHVYSLSRLYSA